MKATIKYITLMACLMCLPYFLKAKGTSKTKFAMVGLSHGHSPWFFDWGKTDEMELVGIFEKNEALANSFQSRFDLDQKLFYTDLETMLAATRPDGILVFGPISAHLAAVEAAAPLGIHVMVEKPLATSLEDARNMAGLAKEHGIYLLTNYETSWYASTAWAHQLVTDSVEQFGQVRKMVFHHGHEGPKEIGVGPEFLEWLTDPVRNGGGALIDFGCYGANIMTYLMHGEKPVAVFAVAKNYKPQTYSKVDDEATIIVDYENSQGIVQASWNWPFNRKDMEVYGEQGYVVTQNDTDLRYRMKGEVEKSLSVNPEKVQVNSNPFDYFRKVISGGLKQPEFGLYTLENNLQVMEILEAAKKSAQSGQKVNLSNF